MIDWYLVSVVVFAAVLAIVFYKDRRNVKRESILLLRKTKAGRAFLIGVGTRFPRFWKALGIVGVIICFIVSAYTFSWLIWNSVSALVSGEAESSFMFVLPSPSAEGATGPGYMTVPFWYWIISIALLVLVHEGLHGIMAAREKVRIKSLGWGLLAIIPLAFVEPDEAQLKKKKPWPQLRVFAAGSFANFMLAGLCVLVATTAFTGMFMPSGVSFGALIAGYPAEGANMTGTISMVNNYTISSTVDLNGVLEEIGPNRTVTIKTLAGGEEKTFTLQTVEEPEPVYRPGPLTGTAIGMEQVFPGTLDFIRWVSGFESSDWTTTKYEVSFWNYVKENYPALVGKADQSIVSLEEKLDGYRISGFIGILNVANDVELIPEFKAYSGAIDFIGGLLFFLIIINFGVGVANLLPIKPLDGGRMWEILFIRYLPARYAGPVVKALSSFTLLLLIANFVVPLLV